MFDNIKNVLTGVAPLLATALGGPFAGVAITALENVFGLKNSSPDQLNTAIMNMTPEQALALKQADNDFKIKQAQAQLQMFQSTNDDIDDARNREIKIAQIDPKQNRPMNIFSYTANVVLVSLNVGLFFPHVFTDTMRGIIIGMDIVLIKDSWKFFFGNSGDK